VPAGDQIGPHQDAYDVVVSLLRVMMAWADWFTFTTVPNKVYLSTCTSTSSGRHWRRYTWYYGPMWCWRQDQIGPHQDAYEVVVSLLRVMMAWADWFKFTTIPNKVR